MVNLIVHTPTTIQEYYNGLFSFISFYLLSFTLSRKSGRKGNPSFNQTTLGVGAPVKRHFSFNPVPSVTTTRPLSLGSTTETLGATAGIKN